MARNRYYEDEEVVVKGNYISRLLKYVKPYRTKFFCGLLALMIITGLNTALPYISGMFVDKVFPAMSAGGDRAQYSKLALLLIGLFGLCYVLIALLTSLRSGLLNYVGQYAVYDLRKQIFNHLQRLSFKYFDQRPAGKILVRVTSHVDGLSELLTHGLVNLISDAMVVIVIMAVMIAINPTLSLVSIASTVPLLIISIIFRKLLRQKWRAWRNAFSNRTAYIHENIMGLTTAQAFNREELNAAEYDRLNSHLKKVWVNLSLTNNLLGPCVDFINTAVTAAVYLVGYSLLSNHTLSPGNLYSFILYVPMFWTPINNIVNQINQIVTAISNMETIFETIDTEPDILSKPDAPALPEIRGDVRFKHVDFEYGDGKLILENVSFDAPAGSTIALVGPTGGGKSTVVNLISRFYDVTGGGVYIDGHNLKDVDLNSLRTQVGVMMQDSFIFSGTVYDNLRYGNPNATDEECIAAAKALYAHDCIMKLPRGYDTVLGERGAGLSMGEKQLISFVRTLLTDPKILILDEATANIDTQTELIIQKALNELLKGRTSFIIAHRLSTIRKADKIMYIANKNIQESGTHEELLKAKGHYYQLVKNQSAVG